MLEGITGFFDQVGSTISTLWGELWNLVADQWLVGGGVIMGLLVAVGAIIVLTDP